MPGARTRLFEAALLKWLTSSDRVGVARKLQLGVTLKNNERINSEMTDE